MNKAIVIKYNNLSFFASLAVLSLPDYAVQAGVLSVTAFNGNTRSSNAKVAAITYYSITPVNYSISN